MSLIYIITGPPGAGKTTVASALLQHYERGVHIPIDDIRHWVVSGLSDSVDWTDETERQFRIAESAAAASALIYSEAGFTVAIDHCRNLPRLNELISMELAGHEVRRILLLPSLEVNLSRNLSRENKSFDTRELEFIVRDMNASLRQADLAGWLVIDSTELTVDETVRAILARGKCSNS